MMSQVPPPSIQRCFSASRAQENGLVIRGPLRSTAVFGSSVGEQVATVNASTSLRTKKRGKVPPRFDTLIVLVSRFLNRVMIETRTYVARRVI